MIREITGWIAKTFGPSCQPLFDATYKPFAPLYRACDKIANATGFDSSTFIFTLLGVLGCVFGLPLRTVLNPRFYGLKPDPKNLSRTKMIKNVFVTLRMLYSAITGIFFTYFMFGAFANHLPVTLVVSYLVLIYTPTKYLAKTSFITFFGYILLVHFYRFESQSTDYEIDFTGPMMVVVLKYISVAFNYADGMKILKQLKKRDSKDAIPAHILANLFTEDEKVQMQLASAQISNAIFEKPSFLEYAAYVCFFPTLLSGPVFEIRPFLEYVKLQNWEESANFDEKQKALFEITEKFPTKAVVSRTILLAVSMAIHVTTSPFLGRNGLIKDHGSFFKNFMYMQITFISSIQKYHVAWLFGEIGAILAGFGFSGLNPKTGEDEWKNVEQVSFIPHLMCTNVSDLITEWNKGVSRWLRNYVYLRVVPHVKRGEKRRKLLLGMMTTMGTSALWHGPYPGYFFFWSFLTFAQTADKHYEAKVTKRIFTDDDWKKPFPGKFLQVLGWILMKTFISYSSAAFHILSLKEIIIYYNRLYWSVHIMLFVGWAILTVMPPLPQRGVSKTTAKTISSTSTTEKQTTEISSEKAEISKKLEPTAVESTNENSGIRRSDKKLD